jgi:hypothetical protein
MKTITLAVLASAALAACAINPAATPQGVSIAADEGPPHTEWRLHPSLGLDALVFLGALSGDALQSEIYAEDVALFQSRLSEEERAALDRIGARARETGSLVGPTLALVFSVAPTDTLDEVLASADDPETRLRPAFERTPYWDAAEWPAISAEAKGDVAAVLRGLRRAGFEAHWRQTAQAPAEAASTRLRDLFSGYDVISEQQRLLGRRLDPAIEVVVLHYSLPYGIRIAGQRFISHHRYPPEDQLRVAAHEILHPPFDRSDEELLRSLAALREDPWMVSIVEDHDPAFGYNDFLGVLDEDSTQALDQIVGERLGFAEEPGERWRTADGGMHMLAAALYRAMKDDGFGTTGGVYGDWLRGAIGRGVLGPENVKRLAAEVVGREAMDAWGPHRTAARTTSSSE